MIYFKIRIFLIAICLIGIKKQYAQQAGKQFTLTGKIIGMDSGYIHIYYEFNKIPVQDSVKVKNDSFLLKGILEYPTKATLSIYENLNSAKDSNIIEFYIQPSNMTFYSVVNNLDNFTLTGADADFYRLKLRDLEKPVDTDLRPLMQTYKKVGGKYNHLITRGKTKADSVELLTISRELDSITRKLSLLEGKKNQIDSLFITQNLNQFIAADMIWRRYVRFKSIHFPSVADLYQQFPEWVKETRQGQAIKYKIEQERELTPGSKAADFTAKDMNEKIISLKDYRRAKYILLDFWASWCLPCREMTPYLKNIYDKYRSEGLEIISIANEKSRAAWLKAIKKDEMNWVQILENENTRPTLPENKFISQSYYVQYLPTLILIDKEQKIIKKIEVTEKTGQDLLREIEKLF